MTIYEYDKGLNGRQYLKELYRFAEQRTTALGFVTVGEYAWAYRTNIPHATFDIYEGSETYCRGIVFEKGGEE